MRRLVTVADERIPFAGEAFGTLGEVRTRPGRLLGPADLAGADLLVVRAITRVNASLVAGSGVRFVGTATSGTDHVASAELARLGIAFYGALGCNANAVAEYMAAAWIEMARRRGEALGGRSVGVVGVGHVGTLVAAKARALGMEPVLNDPPRARETGDAAFRPLDDLLGCDIVSCHTPLTTGGPDPTWRLIGRRVLSRLRPGAWFCNAGRGEVVDEEALGEAIDRGRLGGVVLDVWDHEPAIDPRLVARADIATPHIAGYSLDGKLNGTAMVYRAACRFFGVEPSWSAETAAPPPDVPRIALDASGRDEAAVLAEAVEAVYAVRRDDEALKRVASADAASIGPAFDHLRAAYPRRREFPGTEVVLAGGSPALAGALAGLGFRVRAADGG